MTPRLPSSRRQELRGFAWLELLLVIAVVALLVQLIPGAWSWLMQVLDSRSTYIWLNVFVLMVLFIVAARQRMK